ncbi:MAG: RDD family protein [Flavobacteriales bacterium]|nr:RDD family protein [Flavobacteriales bacterium]
MSLNEHSMEVEVSESKPSIPDLALKVGHGRRIANFAIDKIISLAIIIVLGIFFMPVSYLDSDNTILDYVLETVGLLVYYLLIEVPTGRTVGKLVTKTVVVDEHGNKPSVGQLVTRSFCRIVPFEHFSFLGNTARGWHDQWSDTYVILLEDHQKKNEVDTLDSIFLDEGAAK